MANRFEIAKRVQELKIKRERTLSRIEAQKSKVIIEAVGRDTLIAISKAGPKMKAKLLGGLNLKGFAITDGNNPISLFNTANGMVGEI